MPKTPKFQVCSEDLDLHWSGSDSSLVEAQDGIDGETALETSDKANNDSGDGFGDTISDSFLDRAKDQQQQSVPGKLRSVEESWSKRNELSPGMMLALGAWIVRWSFVLGRRRVQGEGLQADSFAGQEVSLARRKRRNKKSGRSGKMESGSPGMVILSDIEGEEVEGVNLSVVDVCSNREIFTQFVAE